MNDNLGANHRNICLHCGLCCNGVIFADVKLQPGDDAGQLAALGLPLVSSRTRSPRTVSRKVPCTSFSQPCAALNGCECRIYPHRPTYCREFECGLFKRFQEGRIELEAALKIIRSARRRSAEVHRLLGRLGDEADGVPLAARFRRTLKRLEQAPVAPAPARALSRITVVFHDLNVRLQRHFYPGEP